MTIDTRRIIASVIAGIALAALSAAAKSYVDVERLKTRVESLSDNVIEIKEDVKWIRRNIK